VSKTKLLWLYIKIIWLMLIVVSLYGFMIPALISAANTELVLLGGFLIFISFPLMFYMVYLIIRGVRNK